MTTKRGGLPQEFIEQVKLSNNIISVSNRYFPTKAKGKTHWALCPFHHEKTSSFAINESQQFYHCFGCGVGGNVITLVQQMESVDFLGAIELLAKWAGLKMPQVTADPEYSKKIAKKEKVLKALEDARAFYCENLYKPKNKDKLDYLHNRGIKDELIKLFNIGASSDWNEIINHLKGKGHTDEILLDSGVAAKSEKGSIYDAMAERITFSIFDIYGSCIGFTGRTLKDDKEIAKYRNTAQTMVFDKSNIVYGIDVLKANKRANFVDKLIVVEGNVDVISLVGNGFTHTLACMGTALTQFHAKVFKRFSDQIYVCFDGDGAGRKATLRGLDVLQNENLNTRVISLPIDSDPDDFIRKQGKEAFQKLIDNAKPLIDYKLDALEEDTDLKDSLGRGKYLKEATEIIKTLDDTQRELYVEKIAKVAGLTQEAILRTLGKSPIKKQPTLQESLKMPTTNKITKATEFILASIIHKKSYVDWDVVRKMKLQNTLYQRVIDAVLGSDNWLVSSIFDEFEETECKNLESMINYEFSTTSSDEQVTHWAGCMKVLKDAELKKKLDQLNEQVTKTDSTEEQAKILIKIQDILKQLKG